MADTTYIDKWHDGDVADMAKVVAGFGLPMCKNSKQIVDELTYASKIFRDHYVEYDDDSARKAYTCCKETAMAIDTRKWNYRDAMFVATLKLRYLLMSLYVDSEKIDEIEGIGELTSD